MLNKKIVLLTFIIILIFTSCSRNIPSKQQRIQKLQALIPKSNYITKTIHTDTYSFYTIQQQNNTCKNVHVYFEGDGLAWITRHLISDDPTPLTPTTFNLLLKDKYQCKVYIARACQYTNDNHCSKKDWTSHRFSEQIIFATNKIIDKIKNNFQNDNFIFIGYSGGAAIASLIANQRNDVTYFISIAGNLDTELWTKIKKFQPLTGSLNPVNYTNNLKSIKQYHLIGTKDSIIPYNVTQSYIKKFSNKENIKLKSVNATHNCCYEDFFKDIIQDIK